MMATNKLLAKLMEMPVISSPSIQAGRMNKVQTPLPMPISQPIRTQSSISQVSLDRYQTIQMDKAFDFAKMVSSHVADEDHALAR